MRRRTWIVWSAVLILCIAAWGFLAGRREPAGASSLSPSPGGLLGARKYLEARRSRVVLAMEAAPSIPPGDALLVAFPASVPIWSEDVDSWKRDVSRGGILVVAYSGKDRSPLEEQVLERLGLTARNARDPVPLAPVAWWRYSRATWRLRREGEGGPGAAEIEIRAPDVVPAAPKDARVLARGERDVPCVFMTRSGRGLVVVLPSDALSNSRLGNGGNIALLESLRGMFAGTLRFDEFHHGLASPAAAVASSGNAHSLDLLLAELALLYLAAAVALGRQFGSPWQQPAEITGSASKFLLGLGALHQTLRHSDQAAVRLVEAASRLDSRIRTRATSALGAGDAGFLELAQALGREQQRRRNI